MKPISISLSPNVEKDDVYLALRLILRPWLWKRGKAITDLENEFKEYLGVKYASSFNSGRSSFFAILKALALEKNSDVLLQAFTCNAVPNPILWAGLNPVYVDCDKSTFNIDINDLKTKIGPDSKVLIVQHTFGLPANMNELVSLCKERNLILIEDCAHALGAEYNSRKVGTFGDAAFFSFSRDKVISSVYGGIAVTNNDVIGKTLEALQKEFGLPSSYWTFQQLLHPILLHYIILPLYNIFDLGKIFLVLSQSVNILSKAVSWKEKRGKRPDYFPKAFPCALAILALHQFLKLDRFYEHRKELSKFYYENLKGTSFSISKNLLPEHLDAQNMKHSFLRCTVKHPRAHEILYESWHKRNILLGDWYTTCIAPFDTQMDEIRYKNGTCKNAEELANETLNLPTHINCSKMDAKRIVAFLKEYGDTGNTK